MSDLINKLRRGPFATSDMQYGNLLCNEAADEIERLTAENKQLREDLASAEATWIMWRNKLKEKVVGSHDPIDGYCGRRSSKAGLQAGEVDLKENEIKEHLLGIPGIWKTL